MMTKKGLSGDGKKVEEGVAFVIFGVTGDLTRRKLIPALYRLLANERFMSTVYTIGFARRDWSNEKLREVLRSAVEHIQPEPAYLERMLSNAVYVRSTFEDEDGYERLGKVISELGVQNVLYYRRHLPTNISPSSSGLAPAICSAVAPVDAYCD